MNGSSNAVFRNEADGVWAESRVRIPAAAASAIGVVALLLWLTMAALPGGIGGSTTAARTDPGPSRSTVAARETVVGGYGGVSDTRNSDVTIVKPGEIDMTVRDFTWLGKPFEAPIYYGVRVQRWHPAGSFGTMVDFIHAKAIARAADEASFSGMRNGQQVAPKARVGDVFRHLEFSHGHNMLTYNGLFRWPAVFGRLRPYLGGGGGISLPHTEIGFRDKNTRTYEYQYAGLVAQFLGGVEIELGAVSVFFEYKFTYAPYDVPLSEEPRGFILFTDLWRQARAWFTGDAPPGGRLRTVLATHHGVGGVLVRIAPRAVSRP